MKDKRQYAAILALVTFAFTVFPQKPSHALAPLVAISAAQIVGAGGGGASVYSAAAAATGGYIAAGAAGAIGLIGAYLEIRDAQENALRIPLGPNPSNVPPEPVAPSTGTTTTQTLVRVSGSNHTGATGAEACASWGSSFGQQCGAASGEGQYGTTEYITSGGDYNSGYCLHRWPCGNAARGEIQPLGDSVICTTGYVLSGQTCVLANPRQATDDKICDLLVTMGQFATADDRNCSASSDGTKLSPMIRNGNVVAYGTNSSGQPLMWTVSPGPQQYTIQVAEQVVTPSQTQVQTTTIGVDALTGQVVSAQTTTAAGQIASPGAATVPTANTAPTVDNTPTVSTNPSTSVLPDIKFPSDYARQGEAASAAQTVTASTDAIRDQLKSTENVIDPTAPAWVDPWGTTFANLKGWSMPGHTSVCPVGSFAWNNQTYSIDSHCQLVGNHFGALQGAMSVVWSVIALFIVLGA